MEKNFYTEDNFERLLREQTDRFTMQPTKRVWHSVYNDLHPARKWPSVAISLLLIISIVLLGYLNTGNESKQQTAANTGAATNQSAANSPSATGKQSAAPALSSSTNVPVASATNPVSTATTAAALQTASDNAQTAVTAGSTQQRPRATQQQTSARRRSTVIPAATVQAEATTVPLRTATEAIASTTGSRQTGGNTRADITASTVASTAVTTNEITGNNNNTGNESNITPVPAATAAAPTPDAQKKITGSTAEKTAAASAITISSDDNLAENGPDKNSAGTTAAAVNKEKETASAPAATPKAKAAAPSQEDAAWMENYAFYNRTNRGKWKNKLSWKLYATPSVSYRMLFDNTKSGENGSVVPSGPASLVLRDKSIENSVTHKPGPGIEAGAALQYAVGKRWHLKSGLQFNYNSYSVYANEIAHPFSTTLLYNNINTGNLETVSRFTSISNVPDGRTTRMNSYSIQLALPVGFDYKIGGTSNIEWYAGASLQPSFVLGGQNFQLSADRLAFVKENREDNELMRRFNLAFGAETFISYKKGSYTFSAGPSIRYQLLTTNSNVYTVGERVYNFGLSLGVSKKF